MQLNILVVEDKSDACLTLVQWLSDKGHQVDSAGDGQEALALVSSNRLAGKSFDLVLTDLVMPVMDGLTLGKELRFRKETATLVLITGYGAINPRLGEDARALGFATVVDKPIDFGRLDSMVNALAAEKTAALPPVDQVDPAFGTSRIVRQNRNTPLGQASSSEPGTGRRSRDGGGDDYAPTPGPELPGLSGSSAAGAHRADLSGTTSWRRRSIDPLAPAEPASQPPGLGSQTGYIRKRSEVFLDPTMQPAAKPPVEPVSGLGVRPPSARIEKPTGSFTGGYRRSASLTPPDSPTQASGSGGTSSFYRRQTDPGGTPPLAPLAEPPSSLSPRPGAPPAASGTLRIRRGVDAPATGPVPVAGPPSFTVACAHCSQGFVVAVRTEAYKAPCIHCGGLNRIEPVT